MDVVITEIGGTVGDIESLPFLEAIRQFRNDIGRKNVIYIHVTLIPFINASGELKTKPTQHSVNELRSIGIQPDIIVCRSDRAISQDLKEKIALFTDVEPRAVVSCVDAPHIYFVPLNLRDEGLDRLVVEQARAGDRAAAPGRVDRPGGEGQDRPTGTVRIALVGKYVQLQDAYLSVVEALKHAAIHHGRNLEIIWVDAETLKQEEITSRLESADGVLVPGGFGIRGIEGKIMSACYARENKVPFLGLCLGLQVAVAEFARHVARHGRRQLVGVRPFHQLPGHRPAARAEGRRRHGRHHAAGGIAYESGARHESVRGLRRGSHLRAAPPPL